jgi:hypothetical protein
LTTDAGFSAWNMFVGGLDEGFDGIFDSLVTFVKEVGEFSGVAIDSEHQLGKVVGTN